MNSIPPVILFIAARLKIAIMTEGISIPDFIKVNPELTRLPKEYLDYIKGQGKKMLMAMKRKSKNAKRK